MMRGGAVGALALLAVLATACVSLDATQRTTDQLAAQVAREVCLPFVADGEAVEIVQRRLDAAWVRRFPELLTSGPPGPSFQRGSVLSHRATLTLDPGIRSRVPERQGLRDCQFSIEPADPGAVTTAVEVALSGRSGLTRVSPDSAYVAQWCSPPTTEPGMTIHVSHYERRVTINLSQSRDPCAA